MGIDAGGDVEVHGSVGEGGVGEVGDAVRAQTGSDFEVVLLVLRGDRLDWRPTQ